METLTQNRIYPFLQGGGEMGELTRNYDWAKTNVGTPDEWPQSLRNVVSLILHSKFPMFLWWGDELIQFYNDAYRPSLGNEGKHPKALGQFAEECWPEIWDIIYPLIKQVKTTGEATWSEDQLVPIYRNGKIEDVWWTFGYSPVYNEWDKLSGVLVTCMETTQKVLNSKQLAESEQKFRNIVEQSTYTICILKGEDLVVEVANEPLLRIWDKGNEVIGQAVKNILPEASEQGFLELLLDVYHNGKTHYGFETPALMRRKDAESVTLYFDFVYQPYREADGSISGVLVLANDITERVKAKKELAKNKLSLEQAIEMNGMGFFNIDLKTNTITSSGQIMNWFNLAGQQSSIAEVLTKIHPEDQSLVAEAFTSSMGKEGTGRHDLIYRLIDPNNDTIQYMRSIGQVQLDEDVATIASIMQDVTQQVVDSKKLEESGQNLRNIILQAPVAMCLLRGPEFTVEIANERMLQLWDKPAEIILNRPIFEGMPEAKEQGLELLLQNVYTTGETFKAYERPVELLRKGTIETTYLNFVYEPLYEANGNIVGIMAIAVEVTQQVMARKQVEESEARFRLLADTMPQFVWTADKDGNLNYFNQAVYDYSGLTEEQVEQNGWLQIVHPEEREENIKQWEASIQTGEDFLFHHRFKNNKGEYKWQLSRAVPQKNEEGNIQMWIGTSTDIHDHKLFEEELQARVQAQTAELVEANERLLRSNQELKRSNINLEEFAYAASHDMKEPIRKIHFFADRIKTNLKQRFNDEEIKYFERMEAAAKRMGSLIDDLLSYSQVSLRPKIFEDVDLNDVIKQVLNDLELEIEDKKAEIKTTNLPTIKGHKRQMQQAFQNLISNALKFNKQHLAPVITISYKKIYGSDTGFALSQEESHWLYYSIEITDNGIGFEQNEAERIFNVFTRLHGNAEYKGTGVGLSIVRKVAENHKGFVTAKSEINIGTTFQILLPLNE